VAVRRNASIACAEWQTVSRGHFSKTKTITPTNNSSDPVTRLSERSTNQVRCCELRITREVNTGIPATAAVERPAATKSNQWVRNRGLKIRDRESGKRNGSETIRLWLDRSRLIGLVGFEPTASSSRTRRSTKLSHSPRCVAAECRGLANYFAYLGRDGKKIACFST
jgi:hypothetical protein